MQEMDIEAINLRLELAQRIKARLTAPPVIACALIVDQRSHLVALGALRPVLDQFRLRPAGAFQAITQVVQFRLIDGQREGMNLSHCAYLA